MASIERLRLVPRRAKIICTLGPAVDTDEQVRELIKRGMDAARLNLSYGTREGHVETIHRVRRIAEEQGRHIAIIADLPGPKVRVGRVAQDTTELTDGQKLRLYPDDGSEGSNLELPIDPAFFHEELARGDRILLADGTMELRVVAVGPSGVETKVVTGGRARGKIDVHLPGVPLRRSVITQSDVPLLEMVVEHGLDYLALTYVRDGSDILEVHEHMERLGQRVPIIAKIERAESFSRLDGILKRADGIMIRRGDLGAQLELSRIPIIQKEAVRLANNRGVPVIIGTQMLGSMVEAPIPTRAEASDVSNAIADGADGVMLAAETAVGRYPLEAIEMMERIVTETERETFKRDRMHALVQFPSPFPDTTARMACRAAYECEAKLIACFTQSGRTAGFVSKYRPEVPVVAFCPDGSTQRRLALHWGVQVATLSPVHHTEEMVRQVDSKLLAGGAVSRGDRIVIVFGAPVGEMGHTNSVRLHQVGTAD